MARKLFVEVIADAAKFIAGMELSSKAVNGFSADVQKASVSTELAAKAQVAAAIKTTESLKAESVAYHQLAAAAVQGSQEQIAAANLAAAADRKLAASMGIASAEGARLSGASAGTARELERVGRGALSGTGLMHGFGRSLAFASGGFLAFEGVTSFLTDSIKAARDAGVAQRSLAAQMKASGESFTANQAAVEKATLSLGKFGFTSEDSEKALTVLERGTGNITRAISLQGVAANLARAKNIDLASAANVLAKVFGGQETALRRAVPGLAKHEHGLALIADAERRLAGQAAAATTPTEKFHATLHNTEVIIGTALLPTLNKFLGSLGNWLQKMNESGRLQKDVNAAVKTATGIFEGVIAVVKPLAAAFKTLGDVVGGTKQEVKLLALAFGTFKIASWVQSLGLLTGSIKGVGTAAKTSAGEAAGLRASLAGRSGVAAAAVVAGYELSTLIRQIPGWDNTMKDFGGTLYDVASNLGLIQHNLSGIQARDQIGKIEKTFGSGFAQKVLQLTSGSTSGLGGFDAIKNMFQHAVAGSQKAAAGLVGGGPRLNIPGGAYGNVNAALTAAQQRQIGLAADPQNLALLRQQAQADQAALEFAKKLRSSGRISNQKYVEEVTAYASDLQQTNSTIAGILSAARQKVVDAAKAAAEKRQQAAEKAKAEADKAKAAQQAAQQTLLDRAQFAVDRTALTSTLTDDLKALQSQQATIKHIIATQGTTLALQQQLLAVELAIKSKQQEITDARKARVDAASVFQLPPGLQVAQARAEATGAQPALLRVARLEKAAANEALRSGKLSVQAQIDAWNTIGQANQTIADNTTKAAKEAKNAAQATQDAYAKPFFDWLKWVYPGVGFRAPVGVNLTPRPGVGGGGSMVINAVHVHGVQNARQLTDELVKIGRGQPHTRRGAS